MNYEEALDYLLNHLPMFQRNGAAAYKADLSNITKLCAALGNPQQHLKCIHIAGTNGKGSVTHIISSVLISAGFKVGIYTSPHYLTFLERIKIGNQLISETFVAEFVSKNIEVFKTIDASFFEITTAMMFEYFKQEKVDFCVIETGLGGRLDSTNIINPLLSIITNISYDHQQFLGNTLPEIAAEKAGIIKPKTPVVIGERQKEIQAAFIEKATKEQSPIFFSDEIVKVNSLENFNLNLTLFPERKNYVFTTDLSGFNQEKNLQTALASLLCLQKMIPEISLPEIEKGIKKIKETTYFIGRLMVIEKTPLVIFDSAHNEAGIRNLLAQIERFEFEKLHFVYGTVADKDIAKVLSLLPKDAIYYFCKPSVPRGKNALELQTEAAKFNIKGNVFDSAEIALSEAKSNAAKNDLILLAGSIFLVADVVSQFAVNGKVQV
ncbi:MAG: bifunctional folylpolyglutamate synthase/dihydrofolate synthase [Chitinophagales bacterium]|nr:bifunctional folylpolyglutamate synthase/dihydrofolate synthase [Chitinophagales bacterium]HRN93601.1 folylpolyglutamate synthase/dihydrofolate synthase family protein [Chitinophagales bacterium]HRP39159.1 folylpolyglutamate synthase/dihydrofolate synthase family protein [Chitinophagales bacterium]